MREKILSFFSFLSDNIWDFFPSTPLAYLGYLLFITTVCLYIIYKLSKKAKTGKKTDAPKKKEFTLDDLLEISENSNSTTAELLSAMLVFQEKYVVAQDKEKSLKFFENILNHKNRHKKVFDYFHGVILPKNITFKDELDKLEKRALNR